MAAPHQAAAGTAAGGGIGYNATMTQGTLAGNNGFSSTAPYGSMSSTTIVGGRALTGFTDVAGATSSLSISSAADPGAGFFVSATGHGTTKTSASRSGYSYSGGVATWTWASAFGFASSGTTPVIIN